MTEDLDNHRRIIDACPERVEGAVMIFKAPPQFAQCSTSISKTRLSSRRPAARAGPARNIVADQGRSLRPKLLRVSSMWFLASWAFRLALLMIRNGVFPVARVPAGLAGSLTMGT
jgi:hypothetical protein